MAKEKDIFVGLEVIFKNFVPESSKAQLVVDEKTGRTISIDEVKKYVEKKNAEFEKEGMEECKDEVSLAVLEALSTETFSIIPEIVNRCGYTKGKVQNRLTKLVNAGLVERGEVTYAANGKTRKGYKKI